LPGEPLAVVVQGHRRGRVAVSSGGFESVTAKYSAGLRIANRCSDQRDPHWLKKRYAGLAP
jgi:hypothetical protein